MTSIDETSCRQAQSYQAALEAAKVGHGYLTYALVEEGLKTSAAHIQPRDGQVLLKEWLDYATERVPQMQEEKMKEVKRRQLEQIVAFVSGERNTDPAKRNLSLWRRLLLPPEEVVRRIRKSCGHFCYIKPICRIPELGLQCGVVIAH